MNTVSKQLRETIDAAHPRLTSITEARASERPYADKWSIKETLGHMIDSASNNHQRIVRMQETGNIGTFTYSQQHWVTSQHYQEEPWRDMVECWYRLNAHLAHIIAHVDPGSLEHVCDTGYAKPASLKFVIEDYLRHLEHHLGQILGDEDPRQRAKWVRRVPG